MAARQCCMDNFECLNLCTHRCLVALKLPLGVRTNERTQSYSNLCTGLLLLHRNRLRSLTGRHARTRPSLTSANILLCVGKKPLSQTPTTSLIADAHRNIFGDGTTVGEQPLATTDVQEKLA